HRRKRELCSRSILKPAKSNPSQVSPFRASRLKLSQSLSAASPSRLPNQARQPRFAPPASLSMARAICSLRTRIPAKYFESMPKHRGSRPPLVACAHLAQWRSTTTAISTLLNRPPVGLSSSRVWALIPPILQLHHRPLCPLLPLRASARKPHRLI